MKRHKRKQKQWSKKLPMSPLSCVLATKYEMPSFPELAMRDRMMEDTEIKAILNGEHCP